MNDEIIRLTDIELPKQSLRFKSGMSSLDALINGGFKAGDLVIISGISGNGKTSLAQTMTYNFSQQKIPCLWFSYEVSVPQLVSKFLAMGIKRETFEAYSPRVNTTGKLDWVTEKIKEGYRKFQTRVVFIDDLSFLIPTKVNTSENRAAYLESIATELKSIAVQLEMVIVLMAHVTKLAENVEPEMQSIAHSSGIYQKADAVLMVRRIPAKRRKLESEPDGELYTDETKIKLVKSREVGRLAFFKVRMVNHRFVEGGIYEAS